MPPRFLDALTGDTFDLDIDPAMANEYGYTLVKGSRTATITDSEFYGAQDPAWLERERLEKEGNFFHQIKKRPG